jgi:tRNA uridine 5-carbamoylmethylation protein Kti12
MTVARESPVDDLLSYTFYTCMKSLTMTNVCIKGVKKADWTYFKSEATKEEKTMGDFFNKVLTRYKEKSKDNWDEILYGAPTLTDKEAEEMKKAIKVFKEEYDFEWA